MKLSVSLSEEDVATLDAYARSSGLPSRSAVLRHALRLLARADLQSDYEAAFAEWDASEDAAVWEAVAGDGPADAKR